MFYLWYVLRTVLKTCVMVVKLKGFKQARFRIRRRRVVLRSTMGVCKHVCEDNSSEADSPKY